MGLRRARRRRPARRPRPCARRSRARRGPRRPRRPRRSAARRRPRAPARPRPASPRRAGPGGRSRAGTRTGPRRGPARRRAGAPPSSHSGATSGKRAASSSHSRRSGLRVVGEHERADRLGRVGEAVAEGLVERQRALVHGDQRLVERVLEHAGVAPGGGRGDRLALVQAHARAGLGEQRGERRADDPAAGDRDVGRAHGSGTSGPPESSCASTSASSSETLRVRRQPARDRRGAALGGVGGDRGELQHRLLLLGGRRRLPEGGCEGLDPLLGGRRHRAHPSGGGQLARRVDAEQRLARRAQLGGLQRRQRLARRRLARPARRAAPAAPTARSGRGRDGRAAPPRSRRRRPAARAAPARRAACRRPRRPRAARPPARARTPAPRAGAWARRARSTRARRAAAAASTALATTTASRPASRAASSGHSTSGIAVELRDRLGAPEPPAAPAREHGHERRRAHPLTASGPSSLRSLTCSCSGENGIESRSSAPAAVDLAVGGLGEVDQQQHLGVARERVVAQRPDRAPGGQPGAHVVEDHQVRPLLARPLHERAALVGLDHVDAVPERHPRDGARVRRRRRPAAPAGAAPPRPRRACPRSPRRPRRGRCRRRSRCSRAPARGGGVERAGGVDHAAGGVDEVGAGREAPVGRLVERLGDHAVEPGGAARAAARSASAAASERCA